MWARAFPLGVSSGSGGFSCKRFCIDVTCCVMLPAEGPPDLWFAAVDRIQSPDWANDIPTRSVRQAHERAVFFRHGRGWRLFWQGHCLDFRRPVRFVGLLDHWLDLFLGGLNGKSLLFSSGDIFSVCTKSVDKSHNGATGDPQLPRDFPRSVPFFPKLCDFLVSFFFHFGGSGSNIQASIQFFLMCGGA